MQMRIQMTSAMLDELDRMASARGMSRSAVIQEGLALLLEQPEPPPYAAGPLAARVNVYIQADLRARLRDRAEAEGASIGELARRAVLGELSSQ